MGNVRATGEETPDLRVHSFLEMLAQNETRGSSKKNGSWKEGCGVAQNVLSSCLLQRRQFDVIELEKLKLSVETP